MESVKMKMHIGNTLKYITDNYPSLTKVVLELIQNSLDSEANEIMVIIDYKTELLCVRDNGSGIGPKKFREAIESVCSSSKTRGKLGQFGIGLLSPLGKCKGFLITSAAKADKHIYNRWVFDSSKILKSPELPEIPMVSMPNLVFSRSGRTKTVEMVNWRTEVVLEKFSSDKSVNAISITELKSLVIGQFSEAMRKLDAEVTLIVKKANQPEKETESFKAANFNGDSLGRIAYGKKEEGETVFDLFLSPKTKSGRKGQILVGVKGSDFRIPMPIFLKSTPELGGDITNLLTSGTFEGSIISSNCSLHQNRKEFFDNEARMNFLIHLESWVRNHGNKQVATIKDSEKDVWLQAVGSLAINLLEDRLKTQMPHLMEVIKSFKFGTLGKGHYGFGEAKTEQEFTSSAKQFNDHESGTTTSKGKGPRDSNFERRPTSHENHSPFTVSGEGTKRKLVKGHSTGLQFVFEEMLGNDHHWEFDSKTGVLSFNMRSDIWAKMETSERNLILYQQYVAIKALELQLEPPVVRPQIYEFLQRELKSAATFITATSAIQPRQAAREVGKKLK